MPSVPPYVDALARVRDAFVFHADAPSFLVDSLELEDCTCDVARAGLERGVPLAALCADLGRVAAETLEHDRIAAITIGRAMARWAAGVYHEASSRSPVRGGASS